MAPRSETLVLGIKKGPPLVAGRLRRWRRPQNDPHWHPQCRGSPSHQLGSEPGMQTAKPPSQIVLPIPGTSAAQMTYPHHRTPKKRNQAKKKNHQFPPNSIVLAKKNHFPPVQLPTHNSATALISPQARPPPPQAGPRALCHRCLLPAPPGAPGETPSSAPPSYSRSEAGNPGLPPPQP